MASLARLEDQTIAAGNALKIVQVCSADAPKYGAVISMMTLSHQLIRRGHAVQFVTFCGRNLGRFLSDAGHHPHEISVRAKVDPLAVAKFAQYLRREKVDVVQAHLSSACILAGLAGRLAKVPAIGTVHGLSGKLSFVSCRHRVAVSHAVKDHLIHQGLPANSISVVYNGIEPSSERPSREDALRVLGLDNRRRYIATVSRLVPLKGVQVGFEAFTKISEDFPDYDHILAGDGPEQPSLIAQAEARGLSARIHFLGYRLDPANVFAASDLFMFPSLKEAMPLVILEAMDAGVPTLASSVGGIPEMIDDSTGWLVPPNDATQLAQKLRDCLSQPEQLATLGQNARQKLESEFSAVRMAESSEQVYDRLIYAALGKS